MPKNNGKKTNKKRIKKNNKNNKNKQKFFIQNRETVKIHVASMFVLLNDMFMTHTCFKEKCYPYLERTRGDSSLFLVNPACKSNVIGEISKIKMFHKDPMLYYLIPYQEMLSKDYEITIVSNNTKRTVKCKGNILVEVKMVDSLSSACELMNSRISFNVDKIKVNRWRNTEQSKIVADKLQTYVSQTLLPAAKVICQGVLQRQLASKDITNVNFGMNDSVEFSFSGKWVIYSKRGCPACTGAKDLMTQEGIKYIEIDGPSNLMEVDKVMLKIGKADYNYWPKIFDENGKWVGGFTDLKQRFNK